MFTQVISGYIISDRWSLSSSKKCKQYSSIFCYYLALLNGAVSAVFITVQNSGHYSCRMVPLRVWRCSQKSPQIVYLIIPRHFSPSRCFSTIGGEQCSAPQCCSAVIIGSEQSIFYRASQSSDSCVGGQHEQRSCAYVYDMYVYSVCACMCKSVFM